MIARRQGHERAHVYGNVWQVLYAEQERGARDSASPSRARRSWLGASNASRWARLRAATNRPSAIIVSVVTELFANPAASVTVQPYSCLVYRYMNTLSPNNGRIYWPKNIVWNNC